MKSEEEWCDEWSYFRKRDIEVIKEIRQEYDKELRLAIKRYLREHTDPKTDYGIQWYPRDEIMKAINDAKVEI